MSGSSASLRLRQAIVADDLALVKRILHANTNLLYNPVYNGKADSSLHLAASLGHLAIAHHLISLGHDTTLPTTNEICGDASETHGISINTDGQTPLHMASANLHTPMVQLLCEEFPSTINRKDTEGRTPLSLAAGGQAKSSTTVSTISLPKPTVKPTEDVSTISTLLLYGADVAAKDFRGNTCLHYACAFGNLKSIRALIQAGADPLCMNFEGWKPELYSLTVQAEVYYRNLVTEFGKRKADEQRMALDRKAKGSGLRIVPQDEDDDGESVESPIGRDRADSGKSNSTFESAMS